jgi:hypothetical protein
VGVLSTGTAGYVTLDGASYRLPASTFQQLESSFAQLATSPEQSGAGGLGELGIDPLRWLVHPAVVDSASSGGLQTTHIRAGVDVAALLSDVDTFLRKASSPAASGAGQLHAGISAAAKSRIAREVQHPTVDVWTGLGDKTVRRLSLDLGLPVSGSLSAQLGGARSAAIAITIAYSDLNQPQTIAAPTTVAPYRQLQTRIAPIVQEIEAGLGGLSAGR